MCCWILKNVLLVSFSIFGVGDVIVYIFIAVIGCLILILVSLRDVGGISFIYVDGVGFDRAGRRWE